MKTACLVVLLVVILEGVLAEDKKKSVVPEPDVYECGERHCTDEHEPVCAYRYIYYRKEKELKSVVVNKKKVHKTFENYCELQQAIECGEEWIYKHEGKCVFC